MKIIVRHTSLMALLILTSTQGFASDVDDLTDMLNRFLASSNTEVAHASFWADDLVYTSSAGLRFGKADILSDFENGEASTGPPDTAYSAAEVDIRVYGDTAIVAFKLVGTPTTNAATNATEYYFNTGTFLRRDGMWRVVAWQATKIPPA